MGWPLVAEKKMATALCQGGRGRWLAIAPWRRWAGSFHFSADNPRAIPADADAIVSPRMARSPKSPSSTIIISSARPAWVGIFLSIFNVHVNRPCGPRRRIHYNPGEFHTPGTLKVRFAMNSCGSSSNGRSAAARFAVRQFPGCLPAELFACGRSGDTRRKVWYDKARFADRVDLPRDRVRVEVAVGDKVQAGSTVMGVFGLKYCPFGVVAFSLRRTFGSRLTGVLLSWGSCCYAGAFGPVLRFRRCSRWGTSCRGFFAISWWLCGWPDRATTRCRARRRVPLRCSTRWSSS